MPITITSVNIFFQNMKSHWIFKSDHISLIFMTGCTVYLNLVKYSWQHCTYQLNIKICMHHWNIQSLYISWKWRTVHFGWIFKSFIISVEYSTLCIQECVITHPHKHIIMLIYSQASSSFLLCGIILKEVKAISTAWSECKVY